jgi:CheY-like chemotaxis protein
VKILYVEDNEDNIYILKRRLGRLGYDVSIATDGARRNRQGERTEARPDPDGPEPAGDGRMGGDAPAQGGAGDDRHPDHRADFACDGRREGKGARRRLRRLRHQAVELQRLLGKIRELLPDKDPP